MQKSPLMDFAYNKREIEIVLLFTWQVCRPTNRLRFRRANRHDLVNR